MEISFLYLKPISDRLPIDLGIKFPGQRLTHLPPRNAQQNLLVRRRQILPVTAPEPDDAVHAVDEFDCPFGPLDRSLSILAHRFLVLFC